MIERKKIIILGSTGSIGKSTLDIIRENSNNYEIIGLTARSNIDELARQALEFSPKIISIADQKKYKELSNVLSGSGIEVSSGYNSLLELASHPVDLVMAAISGFAGLLPTIRAIENTRLVALANKECLVSAGNLFMNKVEFHKTTLLPVDSEHNAIFQVLNNNHYSNLNRIILTASGGPFRTWSKEKMKFAKPCEAKLHPNWSMGSKISIDSATMMNKGLELIEAHHLFGVSPKKIDILIHPQSIVHSLVEYNDGSILAQLGKPDMRIPISYVLAWPDRMFIQDKKIDLANISPLVFDKPDEEKFPSLRIARNALSMGGTAPIILNAANEVAVSRFLEEDIGFLDIASIVEDCLNYSTLEEPSDIESIIAIDKEAREKAMNTNKIQSK